MSPPIRVAVVTRSVFPLHGYGGLERHVYDLIRWLADAGLEVTLITRDASVGRANASSIHARMRIITVPYRTFPMAGRRGTTVIDRSTAYPLFGARAGRVALDLVKRGEIDIVHGFGASVLGYARHRGSVLAPLVMNPQGLEEFGATAPGRARLKRLAYWPLRQAVLACARAADRIIATDRALEPVVMTHLRVGAERIVTIPNAIDLHLLDEQSKPGSGARARGAAGIGDREIVLLSVGRIEKNKGFQVLAAALAALRDHAPAIASGRWRWVIVGDGPFRARLQRSIVQAGLADHVIITGRVADVDLHAWYDAATLFVHPTLYEGSSLVTLEAMAHRRAVVTTDAGGLPDKVRPGRNGWLVRAGDASALAGAISGALGPAVDLDRMGREGRAIVEEEFSWAAAAAATVRLYRDLLGRD